MLAANHAKRLGVFGTERIREGHLVEALELRWSVLFEIIAIANHTPPGSVVAVQIRAGSLGVDLTKARYAGFYSTGFSLGDYLQALARVHRQGQDRAVTYVHFIAAETVDEKVYKALMDKKKVVDTVLADYKKEPAHV